MRDGWIERRFLYLEWLVALIANWAGLGLGLRKQRTRIAGLQRHGLKDRKDDAGKLWQRSSHDDDGCALYKRWME